MSRRTVTTVGEKRVIARGKIGEQRQTHRGKPAFHDDGTGAVFCQRDVERKLRTAGAAAALGGATLGLVRPAAAQESAPAPPSRCAQSRSSSREFGLPMSP